MIVLARLLAMLLVALTVVYASLWFYGRAARRERLEEQWHLDGCPGNKEDYVRDGLEKTLPVLRRRLILGVYAVPLAVAAVFLYLSDFA